MLLANEDEHIYFALIGDFSDAPAAEMPGDDLLLESALAGVENSTHAIAKKRRRGFICFIVAVNGIPGRTSGWAGRKRGKLHEFNRLLRGSEIPVFIAQTADQSLLRRRALRDHT